jgi:hypothetical protein
MQMSDEHIATQQAWVEAPQQNPETRDATNELWAKAEQLYADLSPITQKQEIFHDLHRHRCTGQEADKIPTKGTENSTGMFDGQRERNQMAKSTKQPPPLAMGKGQQAQPQASRAERHAGRLAVPTTGHWVTGPHARALLAQLICRRMAMSCVMVLSFFRIHVCTHAHPSLLGPLPFRRFPHQRVRSRLLFLVGLLLSGPP